MRRLLFTGPGGAGTTTTATAAAVRAARSGQRVVLISSQEPAVEGLADIDGLRVVRVDPQAALERWWGHHLPPLAGTLPLVTVPPASSVVAPPGAAELGLLAELARAAADVVVVDAGRLETAAALISAPATVRWLLGQLLPARLRVLGALQAAASEQQSSVRTVADRLLTAAPVLERALDRLALDDPGVTDVVLVVVARRSALPLVRSATTALAVHGQRPAAVVTRALPPEAGAWWAPRLAEQEAVLAELAAVAPVLQVAESATGPVTADDVAASAPDLPAPPEPVSRPAPERVAEGWRLVLPLPFAEHGAVELTRWGDDLVLTAARSRRSVRLDSLLRRCVITGGTLADAGTAGARLEVGFVPDPQQWPSDLLDSHQRADGGDSAAEPTAAEEDS